MACKGLLTKEKVVIFSHAAKHLNEKLPTNSGMFAERVLPDMPLQLRAILLQLCP